MNHENLNGFTTKQLRRIAPLSLPFTLAYHYEKKMHAHHYYLPLQFQCKDRTLAIIEDHVTRLHNIRTSSYVNKYSPINVLDVFCSVMLLFQLLAKYSSAALPCKRFVNKRL